MYLGLMLLPGAVVCLRLLAPALVEERAPRSLRLLRLGLLLGAVLLLAGALLEVSSTLRGVMGRVEPELYLRYLRSTRHGQLTQLRLVLVPVLLALGAAVTLPRFRSGAAATLRWPLDLALTLIGGALLYTFSLLSHAAAMGGAAPLYADLLHLLAAVLWAGPLLHLALLGGLKQANRAAAGPALRRLSAIGLTAVLALSVTGAFNALTHASEPATFVGSAYGVSLWVKLALFALVLLAAARNRFRLLPRYLADGRGRPLVVSLRLEAVLLLALLLVTGALTTSELPHAQGASTDALENLRNILRLTPR